MEQMKFEPEPSPGRSLVVPFFCKADTINSEDLFEKLEDFVYVLTFVSQR